jgi:hypothetical protein
MHVHVFVEDTQGDAWVVEHEWSSAPRCMCLCGLCLTCMCLCGLCLTCMCLCGNLHHTMHLYLYSMHHTMHLYTTIPLVTKTNRDKMRQRQEEEAETRGRGRDKRKR